jgi:general secretion pathway protein D
MAITAGDWWRRWRLVEVVVLLGMPLSRVTGQDTSAVRVSNDSVMIRFVDTDLRAVIDALGRYLPKSVLVGTIQPVRVSLETPAPVPRAGVATLLKGLVESQSLEFVEDSAFFRVAPKVPDAAQPAGGRRAQDTTAVQLFVIRLKHARAADVAATVNQLFGGGGEFSGASGLTGGTLSDELRRNVVPSQGAPPAAPPSVNSGTRPSALSGNVTIVPDQLTNSLLIRATEADFDVLKEAVDQLDIRPLQVLIEVMIVEARRDRRLAFGTSVTVPPQSVDKGDGTAGGSFTGPSLGDVVITLMHLGHAQIDATLTAAASRGDVQIISRPVLLASNNQEARILVGSQRPFVQVSRSLPTETPTRDQVIQYRDVGTRLTVRPTINQDGYVSLLIQQEVNQATAEVAFDAPVISTREAETQVLVKDGQTIVLGGLRDRERDVAQSGIPILSALPLIGGLFGGSSRQTTETELYLFLTPRIIQTDADADSVTAPRLPKGVER